MPLLDTRTLDDFIERYQVDAIVWKANHLLYNLDNPILRNDRCVEVANMLALIPEDNVVMRDDYVRNIAEDHNIVHKTLQKLVADAIARKKKVRPVEKKAVRKNKIQKLDSDPKKFRFFNEFVKENTKTGERYLDKIKIDKLRFVQLLENFGFCRYEPPGVVNQNDDKNLSFIQLRDNVISSVSRNKIIDQVEKFVMNEYDFEGAKYEFTDAENLVTTMYDQMRTIFNKDLFARAKSASEMIVNQDKEDTTYFYYQNGFVEITKDGWELRPYEEMNGSVWEQQMLNRKFTKVVAEDISQYGNFADFVMKLSNDDEARFKSLCCIIGYLTHDFYAYKLKAVEFTDSTVSEENEGRTGKTLLAKMVGEVRSYCEINGKQFDNTSPAKYQDADLGTQVLHLNDVSHKGKFKFELEHVYNDITEGYIVKKLYTPTFRQRSKIIISTNRTLNIKGPSERDRIIEFEMSNFFSEQLSPKLHYNQWFGTGGNWTEEEFNLFDNFMCLCAQMFHKHGLLEPPTINLGERKLLNHTAPEFLEFMADITNNLKETGIPWLGYQESATSTALSCELNEYKFDRKKLYDRFVHEYSDFKQSWFTNRIFNKWLEAFSELRMHIKKPKVWKSNGVTMIQFIPEEKKS